jgi:hypothetical protein
MVSAGLRYADSPPPQDQSLWLFLCSAVAVIREDAGWKAWALSYGITAAAAGLCIAAGILTR